jgi:hypothetical protein
MYMFAFTRGDLDMQGISGLIRSGNKAFQSGLLRFQSEGFDFHHLKVWILTFMQVIGCSIRRGPRRITTSDHNSATAGQISCDLCACWAQSCLRHWQYCQSHCPRIHF